MHSKLKHNIFFLFLLLFFSKKTSAQQFGNSAFLNGGTNYITIPRTSNYIENPSITFECWMKKKSKAAVTGYDRIIMSVMNGGFGIYVENNKLVFKKENGSMCLSKSTINDTFWHHIALSHNGTTVTYYIDGSVDTSYDFINTFSSTGDYNIGSKSTSEYFWGSLDEIRIWSTVRTASEISQNRCKSVPGNSTGLRAYYKMDASSGMVVADSSTFANHGVVSNGANIWVKSTVTCTSNKIDKKDNNFHNIIMYNDLNNQSLHVNIPSIVELNSNSSIQIFNGSGNLVYQFNLQSENRELNIKLDKLSEGIYIVKTTTAENIFTNKILVDK